MNRQPMSYVRPSGAGRAPRSASAFQRASGGATRPRLERQDPCRCETCGATFTSDGEVLAHLIDAYHGFQCLRCGALYACSSRLEEHHRYNECGVGRARRFAAR